MSLHTSLKLGFILVNILVSTCFAGLLSGKPGKIRPGIDEQSGPLDEVKETSQLEITSNEGSYNIHLAPPGTNSCDYGEMVPKHECEAAGSLLAPNPRRTLQVGQGYNRFWAFPIAWPPIFSSFMAQGVRKQNWQEQNFMVLTQVVFTLMEFKVCSIQFVSPCPYGGKCLDGSWGQVPLGCSVQSGGDRAAHYKTSGDTGPGCIHPHYQLVCRSKVFATMPGCKMQN